MAGDLKWSLSINHPITKTPTNINCMLLTSRQLATTLACVSPVQETRHASSYMTMVANSTRRPMGAKKGNHVGSTTPSKQRMHTNPIDRHHGIARMQKQPAHIVTSECVWGGMS